MEVETCGKPIDSLLEKVLCMNILSSDYFKELYRLKACNEVIDEIYNQVDHVEPWMTGNCRGPSTAFCLLYKLFTMKLTVKQMHSLLNHPDSPYIRAVGFLYLRYVGNSKTLWGWYEQYIKDDEEFAPGSNGKMTTMGVYIRDLLLNQYYFDTLLPRVPVPIMRQITTTLERLKLPTSSAGVTGTGGRHASDDTARRPPSVKASLSVSFGQRAPHRASTRDSSRNINVPRSMGAEREGDDRRKEYKGRDRDRDWETEKPREHDRDKNRDGVSRDRDNRRHELRDYDQDSKRKGRDRDYDSSGRDKDRDRGITEGGRDYYSRDIGRERDRERDRERGKERERDCDRYRDRGGKVDYYRSRSRSPRGGRRYRSRSRSRSQEKFVRRSKSPAKASVNLVKLRDLYGDATAKSNSDVNDSNYPVKDSCTEDVIRLGGNSWR